MNLAFFYVLRWEKEIERSRDSRVNAQRNRRQLLVVESHDEQAKQIASSRKTKVERSRPARDCCQTRDARC